MSATEIRRQEIAAKYTSTFGSLTWTLATYAHTRAMTADSNPANSTLLIAVGAPCSRGDDCDLSARLAYRFYLIAA